MILTIVLIVIAFLALVALFIFGADLTFRSTRYKGPESDHFDGKEFRSLIGAVNAAAPGSAQTSLRPGGGKGRFAALKWMLSRKGPVWVEAEVMKSVPAVRVEGSRIVATFINHATVLIQTEGLNILTDPMFSFRASPVSFMGPKRFAEPGVNFDDLPPIDVVLLSHNHYDHLDLPSLRKIQKRHHPLVIVPLGNAAFLEGKGIKVSKELDWWGKAVIENDKVRGVAFHLVPAQHFSSRALSDRDKTLWGGYVMTTPHGDIYFAGDTGYGPFIQEIKLRFPNGFRLGFLPIGAYEPAWLMKPIHVSPDEAFAMKKDLNIQTAMGIHFGTFNLTDDAQDAPVARIAELVAANPTLPGNFLTLMNGQRIDIQ